MSELESRGSGSLDQRVVTICSGLDFVNVVYNNFIARNEETANVSGSEWFRRETSENTFIQGLEIAAHCDSCYCALYKYSYLLTYVGTCKYIHEKSLCSASSIST